LAQFPPGTEKQREAREQPTLAPSGKRATGCSIRSGVADAFGGQLPKLYATSGIPWMDSKVAAENEILCVAFGVRPKYFFYNDGTRKNARATAARIGGHSMPDGTVMFGRGLFQELLSKFGQHVAGEVAVMAVTAHEWAHILQFRTQAGNPAWKYPELHADFLSGWYMANRWRMQWGSFGLQSAMQQMWEMGDTDYHNPDHHGTNQERLVAFMEGTKMGLANATVQQAFFQGKAVTGY
jgi:hypothetical protein